ncbi:MAG: hypothetical protein C0506_07230 [Anaerolinea sp.]|nr:hypothetical protein [Anaerolinea sp.]
MTYSIMGGSGTTLGPVSHVKVMVFSYNALWEGRYFEEQEVAVYFKQDGGEITLLTVKCRCGRGFPRVSH